VAAQILPPNLCSSCIGGLGGSFIVQVEPGPTPSALLAFPHYWQVENLNLTVGAYYVLRYEDTKQARMEFRNESQRSGNNTSRFNFGSPTKIDAQDFVPSMQPATTTRAS